MPRFLKTLALVTACVVLTSLPARAEERDLEGDEPKKVLAAIDLVEEAYKKAGKLDTKMATELNAAGDPGGAAGQVPYEDANATFADAIKKLRDKVSSKHIRVDTGLTQGGFTRNKKGTDADVIFLSKAGLDRLCSSANDGSRMFGKIRLAATLANEMVHVWQVFAGNDARQCDAERDSDTASIIFMLQIAAAFHNTNVQQGVSATACPKLAKCIADYEVDTVGEWSVLTINAPGYRDYFMNRRTTIFDAAITSGVSWGKRYYKKGYPGPITFASLTGPEQAMMTSTDGMTDRFYTLPTGKKVLSRDVRHNDQDQRVLTIVAQDTTTKVFCTYVYTDTTGDGLPELTPVVSQASTAAGSLLGEFDMFLLPFLPGDQNGQSGWTLLDTQEGTFYQMPIDDLTLLPTQPQFGATYNAPEFSDLGGGFYYYYNSLDLGPQLESWVFTAIPTVMARGDQQALVIDIDLGTGVWTLAGSGLLAQALFPTNQAGIAQLDVGLPVIDLFGYPGPLGQVMMFDIGVGPAFPIVPPTQLDPAGQSGPLAMQPLPPGLFMIETTDGLDLDQKILFQPPFGENIDSVLVDESGDGTLDRLQLTTDPPRLHVSMGVPGDAKDAVQHLYELVLEGEDPQSFESWDNGSGRAISGAEEQFGPFELLPGPQMPLYIQSLRDLDGDMQEDDAVVVRGFQTFTPTPNYVIEVLLDALLGGPSQVLPLSYIPTNPVVFDIDADGDLDLQLFDLILQEPHCYLNDGSGQLNPGGCFESFCFGDGGNQMGCTDCPCGNNAVVGTTAGCLNSAGTSCHLQASGSASIFASDLRFECSGVSPSSTALLISANEALPASPSQPCFGLQSGITTSAMDGIRCVGQGLLRHGARPSDANGDVGATTNGWGMPSGFFGFSAFAPGITRHFQVFYRDDPLTGCGSGLNSSQGVRVLFTP